MTVGAKDLPTFSYPRIRYTPAGGSPITRSFAEAAIAYRPRIVAERGMNRTVGGRAEYLWGRTERSLRIDMMCEPDELQQLEWLFEDHGGRGRQVEVWIERNLGSYWGFEDTLRDQNGLKWTLNGGGSETYEDATFGRGKKLTGGQNLSVVLAQAGAATKTGFDDPLSKDEGVLVHEWKPAFAGGDGVLHHILDTTGTTANRLMVYKTAGNVLTFEIRDAAGGVKSKSGSVAWSANARVTIIASWATDGTLRLWYATAGGAFTELTTASGAGTGILGALPTTLYLGAKNDGADMANGTNDFIVFYRKAYTDPHRTLAGYRPVWRNYAPYAELAPLFDYQRLTPSRSIFVWPLECRFGKKA